MGEVVGVQLLNSRNALGIAVGDSVGESVVSIDGEPVVELVGSLDGPIALDG